MPRPLILSNFTIVSAAGCGNDANINALYQEKSGLKPNDFLDVDIDTWIGRVNGLENQILPKEFKSYQCRNNQLAYMALQQDNFNQSIENAKIKYGSNKIGVFLGTSTSGILSTELEYRHLSNNRFNNPDNIHFKEQHNNFSLADFVQRYFKLEGAVQIISTACSSSAKVFASASRYIEMGLCDAAIVGGVDSLCLTTLYGFNSLELVSKNICRPADKNRNGLSIGEAAAFILLEKENIDVSHENSVYLLGYGETSDAYHMSTPHPDGIGAIGAIRKALTQAKLSPEKIDYINLHGTATRVNDQVEDVVINKIFSDKTSCSSTKGWTGHTLGASGSVEAIYSALCIQNNFIPKSLNTQQVDSHFNSNIVLNNIVKPIHYVLSNSFGFGGNNCSLIFGDNTHSLEYNA